MQNYTQERSQSYPNITRLRGAGVVIKHLPKCKKQIRPIQIIISAAVQMFGFRRSQAEPDFGPTLQLPHLHLQLTNGTNKLVCQSLATLSTGKFPANCSVTL
jgi:hypothetical protein